MIKHINRSLSEFFNLETLCGFIVKSIHALMYAEI